MRHSLGGPPPLFLDRAEAGRHLARRLLDLHLDDPVVVGLPRGGVPVAAEVAELLAAPLDVLVVRKLGCPSQPELGFGAIGEDDARVLNPHVIADFGITDDQVESVTRHEQAELERRVATLRRGYPALDVTGRTVVVVDDGIATGSTARAAIRVLRERGAGRIVLAVPVGPRAEVRGLRGIADDVECLASPRSFVAVGAMYRDFDQATDEEVASLLDRARTRPRITTAT